MSFALQSETERRVERHVGAGQYRSADEVVLAGLELLELRDRLQRVPAESIHDAVTKGLASLDRGEGVDGETAIAAHMADLDGEVA